MPALVPRFGGIPTFMRLPRVTDAGRGSTSRWSACRGTAAPPTAPARATGRARSATVEPHAPGPSCQPASRPTSSSRVADLGDCPVNPIDLMDALAKIEALLRRRSTRRARCRSPPAAIISSRCRSCARIAKRPAARHDPFRRPFRHQRPLFRRQPLHPRHAVPPRRRGGAARSASASSRSASAARSTTPDDYDFAEATGHARRLHGGIRPARRRAT